MLVHALLHQCVGASKRRCVHECMRVGACEGVSVHALVSQCINGSVRALVHASVRQGMCWSFDPPLPAPVLAVAGGWV